MGETTANKIIVGVIVSVISGIILFILYSLFKGIVSELSPKQQIIELRK